MPYLRILIGFALTTAWLAGVFLLPIQSEIVAASGAALTILISGYLGGSAAGMLSAAVAGAFFFAAPGGELNVDIVETAALLAALVATGLCGGLLRKRSLEILPERTARRRMNALVNRLLAVVWEADTGDDSVARAPWLFRFVSTGAKTILGYSPADWIGNPKAFLERVHAEDRDRLTEAWNTALADAAEQEVEFRIVAADGREVWLHDVIRPVSDLRGKVVRMTGRMVDIGQRKAAEHRLGSVLAVTRAIAESWPSHEAPKQLLGAICEALALDAGVFWAPDPSNGVLIRDAIWYRPGAGLDDFADAAGTARVLPGKGLAGQVWESRTPAWSSTLSHDDSASESTQEQAGLRSAMAFPITAGDRFLGVFEFFSRRAEEKDPELLDVIGATGPDIGSFLERKHAEEEVAFRRAVLELQSEGAIEGMLVASMDGTILSANERLLDMWAVPQEVADFTEPELLRLMVAKTKDPGAAQRHLEELSFASGEKTQGQVEHSDGRIFDIWVSSLRSEDGTAFGRAWYFRDVTAETRSAEALRLSRDRMRFLSEVGRELASSLDYEETISRLLRLLVPILADRAVIYMTQPDGSIKAVRAARVEGSTSEIVEDMEENELHPKGNGIVEVARTGRSKLEGPTMMVPLFARGRSLGALTLVAGQSGRVYDGDDLTLAEAVSRRAALAIENARLFEERSHIAQTLQESLLPTALPPIPGMAIAARYRPAGEGQDVGGDFYDVFQYGPRRWGIVIGDVCGKGAEAAALTGLVRYTIRSEAMQEREPARLISLVNEAILSQHTDSQFCTVAYLRVDIGRSGVNLTVVRAGHPAPILLRPNGEAEPLGEVGPALGVSENIYLTDEVLKLEKGETVVLYTDGITDARNGDRFFGDERLFHLLSTCAGADEEMMADSIEKAVLEHAEGKLRDDVAILVLKVLSR